MCKKQLSSISDDSVRSLITEGQSGSLANQRENAEGHQHTFVDAGGGNQRRGAHSRGNDALHKLLREPVRHACQQNQWRENEPQAEAEAALSPSMPNSLARSRARS